MERPTAGSAATEQDCARQLRDLQHSARAPGIAAAIVRSGALTWSDSVGLADLEAGTAPTLDTQFAIGSITKTFTAVLLLQLRDLGRLRLEDRLDLHLPGVAHGDVTLARMLAHLSGLRREPAAGPGGEIWETLQDPDRADLVDGVQRAGRVLEPGRRWHYSNLAFALLGEVVARSFALPWEAALRERLLEPLGMSRTTLEPVEPRARGYLVEPYSDVACPEPLLTLRGMAPAAQLWSTTADLARWAAFLADPEPDVLEPDSLAEMRHPQVIADLESWTLAWGLGLMLYRKGERIFHGHAGGMPGFLSSVMAYDKDGERAGVAVLANSTAGVDVEGLAAGLLTTVLDAEAERQPWRPADPPPPAVAGLLGRWWSEGSEYVFRWHHGRLEARAAEAGTLRPRPPAVFEQSGADRWTTVSGREEGEELRAVRAADGTVRRLYWATYPFTRVPEVFGTGPSEGRAR
jgi:CubicO group peptidase (beta-lactamase class C family)